MDLGWRVIHPPQKCFWLFAAGGFPPGWTKPALGAGFRRSRATTTARFAGGS